MSQTFPTQASIPTHDTFHEVKHSYKKIFKKKKKSPKRRERERKKKVQYNPEDTTKSNITCPIGGSVGDRRLKLSSDKIKPSVANLCTSTTLYRKGFPKQKNLILQFTIYNNSYVTTKEVRIYTEMQFFFPKIFFFSELFFFFCFFSYQKGW